MATIGIGLGLFVTALCWFLARRFDRQMHERKMELLRQRIERRQRERVKKTE
jgi:hypothetical protein